MADRKISELNPALAGNLHNDALVHVVDLTEAAPADRNVQATVAQVRTAILSGAQFGADDVTGQLINDGSTYVVPQGVWYAWVGIKGTDPFRQPTVVIQVYIQGAWRNSGFMPRPSADTNSIGPTLVISDGTNVRLFNNDIENTTVYFRRVM